MVDKESEKALHKKDSTLLGIFRRHKPVQKRLEIPGSEVEASSLFSESHNRLYPDLTV